MSYVLAGGTASIFSLFLFMGTQYLYQSVAGHPNPTATLDNPAVAEAPSSNGSDPGISQLRKTSESFRLVAQKVGPAVVNVQTTKGGKKGDSKKRLRRPPRSRDDENPFPNDPFFDFFEQFRGGPFNQQDMPPQRNLGSGIIIDKKGIVVTNNHVVEGASEILISISKDKTEYKAKILGTDPRTDLAVLQIETKKEYPAAEWANSDAVEVGDWAVAIGSPFELDQSVTVGIISAKGRNSAAVMGSNTLGNDLLQTDAAINPGNSGGPLCDIEGRVMGVNTAIYTRTGGYMGIGFAIPSNMAKDVVSKLISEGKIVRGWLGVLIQPLDEELAKELGIKEGVGVHEVIEESPAALAGIKAGDVVIEVDGKPVKDPPQLQQFITGYKPNQVVKIKVVGYSDKKTRTVSVKIGEMPGEGNEGQTPEGSSDSEPDKLGLMVTPSPKKDGVLVDFVQPGSVAEQAGIQPGDVIVRVNRKSVDSVKTFRKLITGSRRLYLEVKREGRTRFFQLVLP